jgi:hypothetical protein
MTARWYAELPKTSLVVHRTECWEVAAWDVEPSRYSTQLWRIHTQATVQQQDPALLPTTVQQLLNGGETQRYAFHWYEGVVPLTSNSTDNIKKTLCGKVGTDELQALMEVWMSVLNGWEQDMRWGMIPQEGATV